MKRIALTLAFMGLMLTASASSLRYFTFSQAMRTVNYLNTQNELMIYAGYEYEIETYVLLNEAWAERVNSQFFEIWIYGYDAYTGEEIMMPIDLSAIWLFNNTTGHMYSAATYLRFHHTHPTPTFVWMIPPYNPYTRPHHPVHFTRTYHYNIHCYGWMPPTPNHNPYHYHHYYMRRPNEPVHFYSTPYTPGTQRPEITIGHANMTNQGSVTNSGSNNGNHNAGSNSATTRNMITNPGHATMTSSRTSTTASGTTTTTRTSEGTVTNTTTRTTSTTSGNTSRNSSSTSSSSNTNRNTSATSSSNTNRNTSATSSSNTRSNNTSATRTTTTTNTRTTTSNNNTRSNDATNNSRTSSNNNRTSSTTTTRR